MTETEIATLYRTLGHPVFRLCSELTPSRDEALALLLATFRAASANASFDNLRQIAGRIAGRNVDESEELIAALYFADSLSAKARTALEEKIAQSAAAQVKLAVQRSERASFYAATPPEAFARMVLGAAAAPKVEQAKTQDLPPQAATLRHEGVKRKSQWTRPMAVLAIVVGLSAIWLATRDREAPPEPRPIVAIAPASAPVATPASLPVAVVAPAAVPVAPPPPPEKPASIPASAPTIEHLMATFDFGEPLGRMSLLEGRSKKKSVPEGTTVQVRANIPETGYAAVVAQDDDATSFRVITPPKKVEPHWRVLGKTTVEHAQSLIVLFSPEPLTVPASRDALGEIRNARVDLALEPAAQ